MANRMYRKLTLQETVLLHDWVQKNRERLTNGTMTVREVEKEVETVIGRPFVYNSIVTFLKKMEITPIWKNSSGFSGQIRNLQQRLAIIEARLGIETPDKPKDD